jgi:hypothetical protein
MLLRVALIRTEVSEEHIATIIRLTRIGELGTTLDMAPWNLVQNTLWTCIIERVLTMVYDTQSCWGSELCRQEL